MGECTKEMAFELLDTYYELGGNFIPHQPVLKDRLANRNEERTAEILEEEHSRRADGDDREQVNSRFGGRRVLDTLEEDGKVIHEQEEGAAKEEHQGAYGGHCSLFHDSRWQGGFVAEPDLGDDKKDGDQAEADEEANDAGAVPGDLFPSVHLVPKPEESIVYYTPRLETSKRMAENLPPMEYRFLGKTGLKVSVISLGGWLTYGGLVDDERTYACMKAAYDAGINFFDTAEGYEGGASEIVMGKAIKKFGWKQQDLGYFDQACVMMLMGFHRFTLAMPMPGTPRILSTTEVSPVSTSGGSQPVPETTGPAEIVRAFNHVIDQGKAFYWGTSEWSASEIAEAWRVADKLGLIGPVVEQPQCNLLVRDRVENEYRWLYAEHSLGLTVFSPLKQGILTGKYNDVEAPPPGSRLAEGDGKNEFITNFAKTFGNETWQRDLAVVANLKPIAEELNATLAQLALAWALKNPNVSSLITGASRPEQIYENVKALEVAKRLTPEILERIEQVAQTAPKQEPLRF
ncbi:Aldo/keto reductase [Rasamsonia emersonii CBS 393.64]|uniref:Aldo/keto reductase n=1 Tax=Rasamsonia emersonii (strain ATCC 16479 / CBS 393.64 / IMI 116815) TaxID=1408163 RepID=A0A0F4Z1M7_RASE3|nr:Aldo/keto reductase [Rasamsonia emersonii CBS 393.64]KKA24422.1 Aldo/keto reductase [Rasamsonia emersonii CBS 393.64]